MFCSREKPRAVVWPDALLFPKLPSLLALADQSKDHSQLADDVTFYLMYSV